MKSLKISEAEKSKLAIIQESCDCIVKLEHDYDAYRKNSKNGIYRLSLSYQSKNLCSLDSLSRYSIIRESVELLKPVLTNSKNHSEIYAKLSKMRSKGNGITVAECLETYSFKLETMEIFDYYSEFNGSVTHWRK